MVTPLEIMVSCARQLSLDLQTRQLRPALAEAPLRASSDCFGWEGIHVEHFQVSAFETGEIALLKHAVVLQLQGSMSIEWRAGGKSSFLTLFPGQVSVVPAHLPHASRSGDGGEFVAVALDPRFLQLHCLGSAGVGAELSLSLGANDPLISAICQTLLDEVINGAPAGRIYAETLGAALAVHLADRFSDRRVAPASGAALRSRREVRRAIEYIHANLGRDLSLTEMATAVSLSPFHFSRVFKHSTGVSPYQFVLRQRIQRAKELLLSGAETIADVALRVGFCDQSHFTAQFKRICGVTPRQFADRMTSSAFNPAAPHRASILPV